MRDPSEITVLLTGANSGIGRVAATRFAARGVHLLLHARTEEKAEATARQVREETGSDRIETVAADLGRIENVRRLASEVRERLDRLDVLINNAGVAAADERTESGDGIERTFAVNYLAQVELTRGLLPLLRAAEGEARILNVASTAQNRLDFDDLLLERSYGKAYGRSKLALIMFSLDLAAELEGTNVNVLALHPGTLLDTKMVRESFGEPWGPASEGADVLEYLALSGELDGVSGAYYDQMERAEPHEQAHDEEARARLRKHTDELLKEL
jgi:NAD(P)-dependent dehydrogenase (short-subunit alcohol dehydrogenase family)